MKDGLNSLKLSYFSALQTKHTHLSKYAEHLGMSGCHTHQTTRPLSISRW